MSAPRDDEARAPLPEDYRWATFVGGSKDGMLEPVRAAALDVGFRYEKLGTGEVWEWDGERFVEAQA